MKPAEIAGSLVWVAVALWIVSAGYDLGLGGLREPGAGFVIFWAGVLMLGLALALLAHSFRAGRVADGARLMGGRWGKVTAVVVILVLYAAALERLGFILTTALVLLLLFKAIEPQRWIVAIAGAVLSTLAAYVVFKEWLGAQLPAGFLGIG